MTVVELQALLDAMSSRTLVGVTGPPGSGKTHVARFLGHPVVAMDGFHLRNEVLDRLGRTQRKGAPDTFDVEAFVQVLGRLRDGTRAVSVPGVLPGARRTRAQTRSSSSPTRRWCSSRATICCSTRGRGPTVASRLDLSVYVEAPAEVRRARLLARQIRSHGSPAAAQRWIETVDNPNAAIVEQTKARADHLVVPGELPGSPLW